MPFPRSRHSGGKITIAALLSVAIVMVTSFGAYFELYIPSAYATPVSTAVTVLNTPPVWTVDAQESTQSSTSTPTNAGYTLAFTATATDSGNDNYWLIICSASSSPIAHNNAPPSCGSGIQWAISATTTSASSTIAATTTIATAPFNTESNPWYAYVCDGNSSGAQCNGIVKQGTGSTASPFVIDHPPTFPAISNSGPVYPGNSETWNATASTTDIIRGADTVQLFVCKTNSFNGSTSTNPCPGGTWATSTLSQTNPSTSTKIVIPTQDANYGAFTFIVNNFGLAATSTNQGFNSWFHVIEAPPTISAATISLIDQSGSGDLKLITPNATTSGYKVTFTVTDNNSCLNASSTNEIASTTANIYRSGVTQASCKLSTDANTNSCYPYAANFSTTNYTPIICTQDAQTCNATVTNITFTCTFPLWYNADPTDVGSVFAAQNWLASVQANAYLGAGTTTAVSSTLVESSVGNELDSFLAFGVTKTSISYGGLQPGFSNDPLATTTDLQEQGNTGVDENLYGDTMCTTWTAQDSCDAGGPNAGTKIPVLNQHFATSSVSYASGTSLTASTTPSLLGIHVLKTTATSSPQTKNTWWGILIPGAISLSGNYTGQNTVLAVVASSTNW